MKIIFFDSMYRKVSLVKTNFFTRFSDHFWTTVFDLLLNKVFFIFNDSIFKLVQIKISFDGRARIGSHVVVFDGIQDVWPLDFFPESAIQSVQSDIVG